MCFTIWGVKELLKQNAPRKNTFFLEPSTSNQWTETDSLHFARNGMAAAVLDNKIYAVGGSGGGPGGPPPGPGRPLPPNQPGAKGMPSKGNRPPAMPQQNHPVDLEVFVLK